MKLRFAPYWYDRFPPRRRTSYPRHRSPLDTHVAIVGGGLTGCACAWAFTAAGIPVVLLEAGRIGSGATAGTPGLVREDFEASFPETVSAVGLRAARAMWQAHRRAALELPAALRRLGIRCELARQDLLTIAPADQLATRQLRREHDARRQAGLEHRWIASPAIRRDAAIEAGGAIKTHASVLDPYRACLGLADAAVRRGAHVFEHSGVTRIRRARQTVDVHTAAAVVRAGTVVIATGAPLRDLHAIRRHLHSRDSYSVVTERLPAAVRRQLGSRTSAVQDLAAPPHVVRWLDDERVMIQGADQDPVPARSRQAALVQRSGQLMYELSLIYPPISGVRPEFSWAFPVEDTVDGLPYIGVHRNFPRHLFALGLARHGAGAAWLAARLLVRRFLGEPAKEDEGFGFGRIL